MRENTCMFPTVTDAHKAMSVIVGSAVSLPAFHKHKGKSKLPKLSLARVDANVTLSSN